MRRKRKLEVAKTTPEKKRRIELKKGELVRAGSVKNGQKSMAMIHMVIVVLVTLNRSKVMES